MSVRTRGVVALLCLLPGLLLLAGCGSGDVHIDSPTVSARVRATCAAFLAAVPARLAEQPRRHVTPPGALGAAWGDPAITLTCGVSRPAGFDKFASCEEANGVGWFVPLDQSADQSSDVTLSAVGYRPIVQVQLPATYRPAGAAAVIAELAGPVKHTLRLVNPCQ